MLRDFESVEEFCKLVSAPNFSFMHKDKWYLVSSEISEETKLYIIREQIAGTFCQPNCNIATFSTIAELVNSYLIDGQSIAEIIYIANGISLTLLPFSLIPQDQDLCFQEKTSSDFNNSHYNSCLRKALRSLRRTA